MQLGLLFNQRSGHTGDGYTINVKDDFDVKGGGSFSAFLSARVFVNFFCRDRESLAHRVCS